MSRGRADERGYSSTHRLPRLTRDARPPATASAMVLTRETDVTKGQFYATWHHFACSTFGRRIIVSRAFTRALHAALCPGQAASWHSLPQ